MGDVGEQAAGRARTEARPPSSRSPTGPGTAGTPDATGPPGATDSPGDAGIAGAPDTDAVGGNATADSGVDPTGADRTTGDTSGRTGRATLYRRRTGRALAGVAAGIADHLGVRVVWVRAAFAVLSGFGGMGMLAYGLLWAFVPQSDREAEIPEAGVRSTAASRVERQQAYGLMVLGVAMAVAGGTVSGVFSGWLGLPVAVSLVGAAVVWREADESQRRRWRDGARSGFAGVLDGGGWSAAVRVLAGVALVATGIGVVVLRGSSLEQVQFALIAVLATLVGVAVLTVPFWLRLVRDLGEERRARIRTEERAEIAAHLHDSVLQTLALIQRQPDVPREVARLARGQERELRQWLYGAAGYRAAGHGATGPTAAAAASAGPAGTAGAAGPTALSAAVATACGEVEDTFAVSVQHVVVGDVELDEPLTALVQAAREAVVNAAKHAGVGEISVYAEVEPGTVTMFVRDRGAGFDPQAVPDDRHGLADSIRGRMERNGGTCRLRTAPGEGTEVQLSMPRAVADAST